MALFVILYYRESVYIDPQPPQRVELMHDILRMQWTLMSYQG